MSDSRENWVFDEFLTGLEYKANERPVFRSRDLCQPMRGQCVRSADQWEEGVTGSSRVGDGGTGMVYTESLQQTGTRG